MTVAQALIEFLAHQWTVDGEHRSRAIVGTFGIFGKGNVAGVGQALRQYALSEPTLMPYHQARTELAMVHQSVGFARMSRRRATFACTGAAGAGSTGMLTGAALATAAHLPVLLLPSDPLASRVSEPARGYAGFPHDATVTATDAFRPLSRYFDRVHRPEQLVPAALGAMRVLTDPAETGAVTIVLPEDVQAEALEVPAGFLDDREWVIRRPRPDRTELARLLGALRDAARPLIVAGGGVLYSDAAAALRQLAEASGIPVAVTVSGLGSMPDDHPQYLGPIGTTGTPAANRVARGADLVLAVGARLSDLTTSSGTAFQHPGVRVASITLSALDAVRHGTLPVVADARETLLDLAEELADWSVQAAYRQEYTRERAAWREQRDRALTRHRRALPSTAEIVGAVDEASDPEDVVVAASGSTAAELPALWRPRSELGCHIEAATASPGYEIPGGVGVARAAPDRDVIVLLGDGAYLMLHSSLVTASAEGLKIIVVLVQNHGLAAVGRLGQLAGSDHYGTLFRYHDSEANSFETGDRLPINLATNAASLGVDVIRIAPSADAIDELVAAIREAKRASTTTVIHITGDPFIEGPSGEGWWEVPAAEVSTLPDTVSAREVYEERRAEQRRYLR
ncbi:thiamine pyrophosphate-dependent enzyme [Galbitalea soli]|uniref:thiamine pyrophosphate-dependent enzyme n=1 Tax=Galbitalea soli TaxID=1268042 RepID=UPI0017C58694|nr:3D-(3,5/4)-trihydroxycyclohexane-1,2-dione acylhydrolase (decyclizing) [Galbitalea soli]